MLSQMPPVVGICRRNQETQLGGELLLFLIKDHLSRLLSSSSQVTVFPFLSPCLGVRDYPSTDKVVAETHSLTQQFKGTHQQESRIDNRFFQFHIFTLVRQGLQEEWLMVSFFVCLIHLISLLMFNI